MWGHVADLHVFEFGPEKNIQDYHKLNARNTFNFIQWLLTNIFQYKYGLVVFP